MLKLHEVQQALEALGLYKLIEQNRGIRTGSVVQSGSSSGHLMQKYVIDSNESIRVRDKYQYNVVDRLEVNGAIEVLDGGEVNIISTE